MRLMELTGEDVGFLEKCLLFWPKLSDRERRFLTENTRHYLFSRGMLPLEGEQSCTGMVVVKSGRLRAFMSSPEGREISLYRLLPMDVCVLSASCMLRNLKVDIHLQAEEDSEVLIIPTAVYEPVSDGNPHVKSFTLELVSARFSEVTWVLEQLVFSNMGQRLASALLERSALAGGDELDATHEQIANELGTAREVVTRILRQWQMDGVVALSRSHIRLTGREQLRGLARGADKGDFVTDNSTRRA